MPAESLYIKRVASRLGRGLELAGPHAARPAPHKLLALLQLPGFPHARGPLGARIRSANLDEPVLVGKASTPI